MHLGYLIYAVAALATISAHPSLPQDKAEPQARSGNNLQVRQPLNTFHGSHHFIDSSANVKRSSKKHRRSKDETPKKREGKRKVKKRSGTCVAKTASASSLASATPASSSSTTSVVHATETPSLPSSLKSSSSSVSPSSTPVVHNGFVTSGSNTYAHASSAPVLSASVTPASSSKVASTTSSSAAAATSSKASSWTSPDTQGNGPFSGEITYYDLGSDGSAIGACGTSLVDSDKVSDRAGFMENTNIVADGLFVGRSLLHPTTCSITGLERLLIRT